jgi:hypothetical protein
VQPSSLVTVALIGVASLVPACGPAIPPAAPAPATATAAPAAPTPAAPEAAPATTPVPAGWHQVATDRFAVAFPSAPEHAEGPETTALGKAHNTLWVVETDDFWLGLSTDDFKAGEMPGGTPAQLLALARDRVVGYIEGRLVSERAVSLAVSGSAQEVPGLELQVASDVLDLRGRVYLQGQRVYQIIMVYPTDGYDPGLYDRFIGSFQLLAAAEPARPATAVPGGWHAVETDDFAVAFPTAPAREESVEETDIGPSPTTMWGLETDGAWLGLSVNDFPAGSMANAAPSDVLAGARDGALGNVGGRLVSDRAVSIAAPGSTRPVAGLEYQGASPQFEIRARMFLRGDRLYQLIMISPPDHPDPGLYDRFVGSFQLR